MLIRSPVLILVFCIVACLGLHNHAQEVQQTTSPVNFNGGPLYAWPAYVCMTGTATPLFAGEVISNRPFVAQSSSTAAATTSVPSPAVTTGWSNSVNLPVSPAPGGC
jgi:hypothetical protein